MDEAFFERMRRLDKIAEEDEIYQVYKKTCGELESWHKKFARFFPVSIRRRLIARVDYQRMMQQRMIILACLNMDFKNKTEGAE